MSNLHRNGQSIKKNHKCDWLWSYVIMHVREISFTSLPKACILKCSWSTTIMCVIVHDYTHFPNMDQFLKQLAALFNSSKDQGTIWLTHKRCKKCDTLITDPNLAWLWHFSVLHDGQNVDMRREEGSSDTYDYPCLVRVTDGDKNSFSTTVWQLFLLSGMQF